jgi:signal transduction histidine kinase
VVLFRISVRAVRPVIVRVIRPVRADPGCILCTALDVVMFSDTVFRAPAVRGGSTSRSTVVTLACAGMGLLWQRHRWPVGALVALSVHSALASLCTSYRPVALVCCALCAVGEHATGVVLGAAVAATFGCQLTWVVAEGRTSPDPLTPLLAAGVWLAYLVILLLAFGVGRWRRTARVAAISTRSRQDALIDGERRRIARELHDTVAHALTLMTLQAAAIGRVLIDDPGRARSGLAAVTDIANGAVAELRHVVRGLGGAARPVPELEPVPVPVPELVPVPVPAAGDGVAGRHPGWRPVAPAPERGLMDVEVLVETVRGLGREIRLTRSGIGRPVDPRLDHDAYRIVQESVTNALRHSRADACIDISLVLDVDRLSIEVVTQGPPGARVAADALGVGRAAAPGSADQGGAGLPGMAERAADLGGDFTAGPVADGGYRVNVTWAVPPCGQGAFGSRTP